MGVDETFPVPEGVVHNTAQEQPEVVPSYGGVTGSSAALNMMPGYFNQQNQQLNWNAPPPAAPVVPAGHVQQTQSETAPLIQTNYVAYSSHYSHQSSIGSCLRGLCCGCTSFVLGLCCCLCLAVCCVLLSIFFVVYQINECQHPSHVSHDSYSFFPDHVSGLNISSQFAKVKIETYEGEDSQSPVEITVKNHAANSYGLSGFHNDYTSPSHSDPAVLNVHQPSFWNPLFCRNSVITVKIPKSISNMFSLSVNVPGYGEVNVTELPGNIPTLNATVGSGWVNATSVKVSSGILKISGSGGVIAEDVTAETLDMVLGDSGNYNSNGGVYAENTTLVKQENGKHGMLTMTSSGSGDIYVKRVMGGSLSCTQEDEGDIGLELWEDNWNGTFNLDSADGDVETSGLGCYVLVNHDHSKYGDIGDATKGTQTVSASATHGDIDMYVHPYSD